MATYRSLLAGAGFALATAAIPLSAIAATPAEEIVQAASELSPVQAGAVLGAQLLGEQLPAGLQLELVKFLRDQLQDPNGPDGPAHVEAFTEALVQAVLNTALNGQLLPNLASLGIAIPGLGSGQTPTIKQVWDTYGVAKTASFLVASLVVPDLAPIMLPSNVRVVGTYTKTGTSSATTGTPFTPLVSTNVALGQSFTTTITVDIDALVATALDQNIVTDLITIHVPLSTSVGVTLTCTQVSSALLGKRCLKFSTSTATSNNSKVIATNPSFIFAFPLNGGEFPTRVTAQDLLQTVYDALGSLDTQKPRDPLFRSPFTGIPALAPLVPGTGLADLSTQAPAVNYFGLSTEAGSVAQALTQGVVSPLTTALNKGQIRIRERAAYPHALNVAGLPLVVPDWALGVTAGYEANEVRTGQLSTMVVRWHNVGTSTIGDTINGVVTQLGVVGTPLNTLSAQLPSAPATIYYDVPAGQYALSSTRVDAQGAVYKVDWNSAAPAPNLPIPPTLPNLGGVLTGVQGVLGSLGGS